ncbi:hypothetical protein [Labilibacter marinus]|uniref:hypothetical protein n=1 Tax=Labilibacter marinus TaxID=1477105 RepID=UPI0008315957|nr:hypothetical protein [Labilibacter marinus]
MYIYKILVVFMLLSCAGLKAQQDFSTFDKRAKEISALDDINAKKYQLAKFAKSFRYFLLNQSVSYQANSYIKQAKSSDSKYTIYYFNTFDQDMILRLDWFVLYGDKNGRKVLHDFDDNIQGQVKKGNGEVNMSLARTIQGDTDLYTLNFEFKEDKNRYKSYRDLAAICMFEELLYRETAEARLALNDSINNRLQVIWNNPEWFNDKLDGLKRMSTLVSDDGSVKICTWNLLMPNSTNKFFGAVMIKDKGVVKMHPLIDNTHKIRSVQKSALSPKKWLGAIYYDMVSVKDNNYGTYYILLGYKPNNEMTKQKVVECMLVVGNGQVRFGHSIFQTERVLDKRLVFEYNAATNMMLKYDSDKNRIVLDHLAPPSSLYEGNTRFYGPDFSYDAYEFQKGKWVLTEDVDVFNPKVEEDGAKPQGDVKLRNNLIND